MRRTTGHSEVSPEEELPWLVRHLTGTWLRRHPRAFIAIELLVAMWVLTVGVILAAQGYWESVFCFLFVGSMLGFLGLFARALSLWTPSPCGCRELVEYLAGGRADRAGGRGRGPAPREDPRGGGRREVVTEPAVRARCGTCPRVADIGLEGRPLVNGGQCVSWS